MRLPQVSERIKEAPAQALRGVFAGIGQLLLITDKLRNKTPAAQQVPRARTLEPLETAPAAAAPAPAPVAAPTMAAPPAPAATQARPAAAAAPARSAAEVPAEAEKAAQGRDFDKTGNVRLLKGHIPAASAVPAPAAQTETTETETAATATEAVVDEAETVVPEPAATADAEVVAPLPNYDELSVASLRARLRNLDVAQLRQLVEYEQAHANRADVIAMFTRRIAKLQAETTPEERGEAEAEAEIESQEDVEADVQEDVGAEEEGEE
jgi:hypothetical protein